MKHQDQRGFAFILEVLLIIFVLAVIALIFYIGPGQKIFSKEPACGANSYLRASPVELDQLPQVYPLGNINAPVGHIFPSDHAGLSLKRIENPSLPGQFTTIATDIRAPGVVHIYSIKRTNYFIGGQLTQTDNALDFNLCRGLSFYFGHVQKLSSALEQVINNIKGDCQDRTQGNDRYRDCNYDLDYKTTSGEVIGSAGGPGTTVAGVDFGVVDKNKSKLGFIRQKGQPDGTLYGHCPFDYFQGSLRDQLYAKLPGNKEPRCGQIMQDKSGTFQGDWYVKNSSQGNWSTQFAMLHNNIDPDIGVVSIGGTIGQAGNFNFSPTQKGLVNHEPSEDTANSQIYCYYNDLITGALGGLGQTTGQVLLQLIDGKTLKAEHQNGNCSGTWSFRSPMTYVR